MSLLVIKVHGFLVTGNLLLLGEGFTSFFGILAVIFFIIGRNLRHQKILIEITQALFLITGIFFLMLGSFRVFDNYCIVIFGYLANVQMTLECT